MQVLFGCSEALHRTYLSTCIHCDNSMAFDCNMSIIVLYPQGTWWGIFKLILLHCSSACNALLYSVCVYVHSLIHLSSSDLVLLALITVYVLAL